MSTVAIPFTFTASTTWVASEINSCFSTIYNEFNGNIDNANIKSGANIDGAKLLDASILVAKLIDASITDAKLKYTDVLIVRAGPNFVGANGVRLARGRKTGTYAAGVVSLTITFSSDADDGNPAFSATPRFVATVEHTAGGAGNHTVKITALSATSATVEVRNSAGGADSVAVHWLAMGAV